MKNALFQLAEIAVHALDVPMCKEEEQAAARRIQAAILASSRHGQWVYMPNGWIAAPLEPTLTMHASARLEFNRWKLTDMGIIDAVYRAHLEAIQKPEM
ncbi:hypothetical protein [Chromobacterium haemolyticum]|uniref:hypothetical protein n=1 Tax=Chromobacterium haemolyticum TaxID=394935 RepID=UPI0009D9BE18|nr:hypothetical protein [Chromobacterium haemolyticum]OQS32115.1 hypothetical protein B0T39_23075 [Chromobacterium haemolyticum]